MSYFKTFTSIDFMQKIAILGDGYLTDTSILPKIRLHYKQTDDNNQFNFNKNFPLQ